MALDFDELRRLLKASGPHPRLRWNELTGEVKLPLSDCAIAAAGSNHPRDTALAMIAAYEALPELLTEVERLRSRVGELEELAADSHDVLKRLRAENDRLARRRKGDQTF